jgi:hypothetical protein
LNYLSLNGKILADGSINLAVVLCDVNLDDRRPGREGKITRFMERKEKEVSGENLSSHYEQRSMIDITFRMKGNDMFGKIKIKRLKTKTKFEVK